MGFETVGPNEALIVSGRVVGGGDPHVVVGGTNWVWPVFQKAQRLSLEVITLKVDTKKVYTVLGVAVSVSGVASVKVNSNTKHILRAAEQFINKSAREIENIFLQTIEGHQRAIMGTLTVEEIYKDRNKFASSVRDTASADLENMGMEIVSYTIRDIDDEQGYLDALGQGRTAEVKRDADIGKAEAERDAGIQQAAAEREKQIAKYQAETNIADSAREFAVKKANYDAEVNAKKAESDLAYELQTAKTRQKIRQEEVEIQVVERKKQIQIQEQEIIRKELELDATVKKPAAAERAKIEMLAQANKIKMIKDAEGQAQAIQLRGEAEAQAIKVKGEAEAEAMTLKANAWKQYGEAALVVHVLEMLPSLAGAIAAPLAKTEKIVMINQGGDGMSASKLTKDIAAIIAQLPPLVESMTGIDITTIMKNFQGSGRKL